MKAWCKECSSMKEVEDEFSTDTGDRYSTVQEFWVTCFSCGHSQTSDTGSYPSPLQDSSLPSALPDPWANALLEMEGR